MTREKIFRPIDENLGISYTEQGSFIKCLNCDHLICYSRENYEEHVLIYNGHASEGGPNVCVTPELFVDENIVLRQLCCPSCYALLSTEIIPKSQPTTVRSKRPSLVDEKDS